MLIGISGHKQSGKNTVASMLQYLLYCKAHNIVSLYEDWKLGNYKSDWIIKSFAENLKKCISIIFNIDPENLEKEEFKCQKIPKIFGDYTWREVLQKVGTDLFRNQFNINIWVNSLASYYNGENWIISDVRFPNEVDFITKNKGIVIRVSRNKVLYNDKHISETILDDFKGFNYGITNNGSLHDLFIACNFLVSSISRMNFFKV